MNAIVIGGAECWQDDLTIAEWAVGPGWADVVAVVNDVGTVHERVDYWCTLHAEKMAAWRRARKANGLPDDYTTWSCTNRKPVIENHHQGWIHGSSSLYAVSVVLYRGATRVLCIGCPMDARPNAFRDEKEWRAWGRYRRGWNQTLDVTQGVVKSASGWTRDLLGPLSDWPGAEPHDGSGPV